MFEKIYMSSGYGPTQYPNVQFNHNDLNELVNKQGLKMSSDMHEAFIIRFKKEIEKAAQNAIVAEVTNLLANPHVANVFEVKPRELPELKDIKLQDKVPCCQSA